MAFKNPLPTVQQLIRLDKPSWQRLITAIKALQDDATSESALISTGLINRTNTGLIYTTGGGTSGGGGTTSTTGQGALQVAARVALRL